MASNKRPDRHDGETTNARAAPPATASRVCGSAQNYDEAPPGQAGPDFSAKKPVFTRGPSVMDYTAVTSAAATPAGEIANPMAPSIVKGVSRQRESHLPDLDVLQAEAKRSSAAPLQPKDETTGSDAFESKLSRAEVETGGPGGTTDNWRG